MGKKAQVNLLQSGKKKQIKLTKTGPSMKKTKSFSLGYARVSSDGKKVKASVARQTEASKTIAKEQKQPLHMLVSEVISGSLKASDRKLLNDILECRLLALHLTADSLCAVADHFLNTFTVCHMQG